jgi:hypothetical protein
MSFPWHILALEPAAEGLQYSCQSSVYDSTECRAGKRSRTLASSNGPIAIQPIQGIGVTNPRAANDTNTADLMAAVVEEIDADYVNLPGNPEVSTDMIAEVSVAAAEAGGTLE